jgi:hypothetical protein
VLESEIADRLGDLPFGHLDNAPYVLADQAYRDDAGFKISGKTISQGFADLHGDYLAGIDSCRHCAGSGRLHADDAHSSAVAARHSQAGGQRAAADAADDCEGTIELRQKLGPDGRLASDDIRIARSGQLAHATCSERAGMPVSMFVRLPVNDDRGLESAQAGQLR